MIRVPFLPTWDRNIAVLRVRTNNHLSSSSEGDRQAVIRQVAVNIGDDHRSFSYRGGDPLTELARTSPTAYIPATLVA